MIFRLWPLVFWCVAFSASLGRAGYYPAPQGTQNFDAADGVIDLADGSRLGAEGEGAAVTPRKVGVITGTAVWLGERSATNTIGSFRLPDLDPGNVIRSFDLTFGVVMDKSAVASASRGWSWNFGPIPNDNGTGEGGFAPLPGGLTVAFKTAVRAGESAGIEVLIGGVSVTNIARSFTYATTPKTLIAHWDASGLDLTYAGAALLTDFPTPGFSPGVGHVFAFSARATDAAMDVTIDTLRAATQAVPVIETGGPVISEFVANNANFEDEFAEKPSWIEIMNGASTQMNLEGWYLTDNRSNLTRWRFGRLSLSPYNYQVVFASGLDRQLSAVSFPHANFSLSKSGGYVALVKPDGKTIASEFSYGPQEKGVAYGEQGVARRRGFLFPPSPGQVNATEAATGGLAPEVLFSELGGFRAEPVSVALAAPGVPNAVIRYTLDRTEPGPNSAVYSAPISVTRFGTIRARAYAPDRLPGRVSSQTYVFIDGSLTNLVASGKPYDSNLPFLFVDSFGVDVDGSTGGTRPFRPANVVVVSPDPATGRAGFSTRPDYTGPAGVHVRGESSAGFDQRSYALELWDESGVDRSASLAGMPEDSDWVLYGPWSEKTLMRNKLVFDWMRAMRGTDGTAVRTRFVELFFNQSRTSNGQVGYSIYRGVYVLMEKLKRGKDRLPIQGLNDKTVDPELITGGYIFRKDKDDALKNNWTTARFSIPLQSFDPDRLNSVQFNYLRGYINSFETALNSVTYKDPTVGYRAFMDPDTFIDAQWMCEVTKQVDGYVFSTYFHKDRGGRLRAGPLWDFNISLGNADYASGDRATGWNYDTPNGVGQLWYPRLHTDPDYKLAHWDRYWEWRRTVLAPDRIKAAIDANMTLLLDGYTGAVSNRAPVTIQNAVARHFRRWPRLGTRDWPNPPAETSVRTWQDEVNYMRTWLTTRMDWLDDQSMRLGSTVYRPPVLQPDEGDFSAGGVTVYLRPFNRDSITSRYPQADIYFTLDGSDPRLSGGGINPAAQKFSAPIRLRTTAVVQARLYNLGQWSPLAASVYRLDAEPASAQNLVVSEFLYAPSPAAGFELMGGIVDSRGFEFVELRNIGSKSVDLSGARFDNGITFDFTFASTGSRFLNPGESGVIVSDPRAFFLRYPRVPASRVLGQFRGHLDTGGETVTLLDATGGVIQQFRYDNAAPWPVANSDLGQSLVLKSPSANPNPGLPANWVLSARSGGTPGVSGVGSDRFAGDPRRDSDGDGVSDLWEFASGSDPENPASAYPLKFGVAPFEVTAGQADFFTIQVRRDPQAKGVKWGLEWSRDLRVWSAIALSWVKYGSVEQSDGTLLESYRSSSPITATNADSAFVRALLTLE